MVENNDDFKFKQKGEIGYFISVELDELEWLTHAFTTRNGGISALPEGALNLSFSVADNRENVIVNRCKLLKALDITDDLLFTVRQVHGDHVLVLDKTHIAPKRQKIAADAMVTDQSGLALATQVADCYPVLLVERRKRVIANIHAGWRGTLKGIVGKTLKVMQEHFQCQLKDTTAVIGPGIGKCCYEVGQDVIKKFQKHICLQSAFWQRTSQRSYFLDLLSIIKGQLFFEGLRSDQIKALAFCTSCHSKLFFSYRRDGKESGRMMAVISKK